MYFAFGDAKLAERSAQIIRLFGLRERLELCAVPQSFRGTAIALVTAGLLSLAFMGFAGLVKG